MVLRWAVFKALAGGVEDAASKPALASLLATIWSDEYEDERDARFINDRVHGNIQKDGTFSVIPEMPGGVCTPDELIRIAKVAVKYKVPLVKLTGGQRIDLVGIPKDQLPAVWSELGMLAPLGANGIARARAALERIIAASVSATACDSPTRSNDGGSTARRS
jgi:nitrite reductase (NADH) large subunit